MSGEKSVYALEGSPDWRIVSGNKEVQQFIQWFESYQNSSDKNEQFRGIHLDIEAYLLENWVVEKQKIVTNYQEVLRFMVLGARKKGITIGVDIPF